MLRIAVILFLCPAIAALATDHKHSAAGAMPTQFEIGRHTFIDVGPPFHFYEIISLRPGDTGTIIERIIATPAGDRCTQPPTIETKRVVVPESVPELLAGNPCSIPEKELTRERKRCKKCLVFSGADVVLRAQCAGKKRLIRADILDRDMFDPNAGTPKRTEWTMQLLNRLDTALGPGVLDKPMFAFADTSTTGPTA